MPATSLAGQGYIYESDLQGKLQCVAVVHGVRCERVAVRFPSFIDQYTVQSINGALTRITSCSPLCEECYQAVIASMRKPSAMTFDSSRWNQVSDHSWIAHRTSYMKSKHKRLKALIYKHHSGKKVLGVEVTA